MGAEFPRSRVRRQGRRAKVSRPRALRFGPLAGYVGYALRRAQGAAVAGFLEEMQEVDLRPTQFAVLVLINENPGTRQSEICTALGLQKANFVPLLRELERRELAIRKAGVPDRRSSALHLTAHGEEVLKRALELHSRWDERVTERVGERGRKTLLRLLKKLM